MGSFNAGSSACAVSNGMPVKWLSSRRAAGAKVEVGAAWCLRGLGCIQRKQSFRRGSVSGASVLAAAVPHITSHVCARVVEAVWSGHRSRSPVGARRGAFQRFAFAGMTPQ